MKDVELRLALVCYGGVSLAVYMHGVTKELLKLVRASRAYWAQPRAARGQTTHFPDGRPGDDPGEVDSEAVYFECLSAICREMDLRVVIDVITGASAGGINGIILARALAHDLSLAPLRDVWLRESDVARLLERKNAARVWSKWFLRPLVYSYVRRTGESDPEMRDKLSRFLRSRWFRPPFDGEHLAGVLHDAMLAMGEPATPGASLLPPAQRLDLAVTVTDFYGYPQRVAMYDPPVVTEREHRHDLRFRYVRHRNGEEESDFAAVCVPALAFAARATSSFPGAFPPAQLDEMDRVCAARGAAWTGRERFVANNFAVYRELGVDPALTSFVDGSVLNNKPFAQAMAAIRGRPAHRQVDRRLVYIDPDPAQEPPPPDGSRPGWLATLKGALSDLPRNEPVFDDLGWVRGYNTRVRGLKESIEMARPQVSSRVRALVGDVLPRKVGPEDLALWREAANALAAREGGLAYDAYVRHKMLSAFDNLAGLVAALAGHLPKSPAAGAVARLLEVWADKQGIREPGPSRLSGNAFRETPPSWVRFMLDFDVPFRTRRLRFVIRQVNLCYGRAAAEGGAGPTVGDLNTLKSALYEIAETLRRCSVPDVASPALRARARELLGGDPAVASVDDMAEIVGRLGQEIGLRRINRKIDDLLAAMPVAWKDVREDVLIAYVGFAFWDPLTFSLTNWREADEYEEILVHRISPEDARSIRAGGASATLKGIDFGHFGAFFSRRRRENDYLWGRLHAAERVIDILLDAARRHGVAAGFDAATMKRRAFETILASEASHLTTVPDLIAEIAREVAGGGATLPDND